MISAIFDTAFAFWEQKLTNFELFRHRWEALSYADCEAGDVRGFLEITGQETQADTISDDYDRARGVFTLRMALTLLAPTATPEDVQTVLNGIDTVNGALLEWERHMRSELPKLEPAGRIALQDVGYVNWQAANSAGLDRPALGGRSYTGTTGVIYQVV